MSNKEFDTDKSVRLIGATIFTLAMFPVNAWIYGVVVMNYWAWFIAPVFGLSLLTLSQAIGLGTATLLVKSMSYSLIRKLKDEERHKGWERAIFGFIASVFLLIYGYLVHIVLEWK